VIIDLHEEEPPAPAERRRGRYTLLICLVVAVGLFAVCPASILWLRWHSDQSLKADRARGETLLAAIVLPQQWQRGPAVYTAKTGWVMAQPSSWAQQIATGSDDLTAVQTTLTNAVRAANWTPEYDKCYSPPDRPEIDCSWRIDGYWLRSEIVPDSVTLRIYGSL